MTVYTKFLTPPRRAETIAIQSFAGTGLTEHQIIPLVESLVKKFRGQLRGSQSNVTTAFLRPFFSFLKSTKTPWPTTSADWQLAVFGFFQFYLVDTAWSQAKTAHRMRLWQTLIGGLLEFLIEEEIIPLDVKIPKIRLRKIHSLAKDQPLLGQPRAKFANFATGPKKILVDISFGVTDSDYLYSVEQKCRHLVDVIRDTCMAHWDALMQDGETGEKLAKLITGIEIEAALDNWRNLSSQRKVVRTTRFASPSHYHGHARALAIVHQKLASGTDKNCVSVDTLRASPLFPKRLFFTNQSHESYSSLGSLTALKKEQFHALSIPSQFYRFAGLLSNLDAAAACCLLIIEHPEFTSESLQNARLLNASGKPYLLLTDNNEHSILSLDKPRAGRRKSVVLTSISQKLIFDIIKRTAPVREILRRAGDKTWRYLFIGVRQRNGANGLLGVLDGTTRYVTSGYRAVSIATLYPELSRNGLNKDSFNYRRLRNTLGVIRWFETGSILEMSRRLGNSRKVALEHYLPPALLHAWNTRIIRRFQNTLIVLAAHDKPYLLEVTDFSNIADLQHFIAQLILDYPAKSSPLADEVQRRMRTKQQLETASLISMPGLMNVRLSPISLSLLYSYSDLALRTLAPEELDKVDVLSRLAPRQFTDLATLLRHAAESDRIHASLSESLDVPLLKRVHKEALLMQIGLDEKFSKFAIKNHWNSLS